MKAIDILKKSAGDFSSKPVIIDNHGTLTYKKLWEEVTERIQKLNDLGLRPGENVALQLSDSREFIIYLFAVSGCGATVVPLGVNLKTNEFTTLLKDLSIDKLIHHDGSDAAVISSRKNQKIEDNILLTELLNLNASNKPYFPNAAFIRPTSGTTGKAKGVVFSHQTILSRIDNALKGISIDSDDRILWVLPMAYHFIVSIILYVRAGAAVIIPIDKTPESLIEAAHRNNASMLYAGPMEFIELANMPGESMLPPLKWCICTVGGVSSALIEKFNIRQGNFLRQVYGMIEVGLAIGNISEPPCPFDSVGKVMPGFEVKVVTAGGLEAGCGEIGELKIKGIGLFDGYFNPYMPRQSIENHGYFGTGDLVSFDKEGNFYVAGREKSALDIDGMKVLSEEIESVINDHPAVKVSRVYVERNNKKLIAEIELIKGKGLNTEELCSFCKGKLEDTKIPQSFLLKDQIPLTATGKVLRHGV